MKPTWEQAIEAGIEDNSYKTVHGKLIRHYYGRAKITLPDGSRWLAIGHPAEGTAHGVRRHGWIEVKEEEE